MKLFSTKVRACEGSQPLVGARREVTFAEAREREALHINLIFPHRNEQTAEISLIFFFLTKKLLPHFANTFAIVNRLFGANYFVKLPLETILQDLRQD